MWNVFGGLLWSYVRENVLLQYSSMSPGGVVLQSELLKERKSMF